jgi:hypothetical protein
MEGGTMFRFTIRELLILTVTAGLAVGWWLEHRQLGSRLVVENEWRLYAGGLEQLLTSDGWRLSRWHDGTLQAVQFKSTGGPARIKSQWPCEPQLNSVLPTSFPSASRR